MIDTTCPTWDLTTAYTDIEDAKFKDELSIALNKCEKLRAALDPKAPCTKEQIRELMPIYEEAKDALDGLLFFTQCLGTIDTSDTRIAPMESYLLGLGVELNKVANPIFDSLMALSSTDPFFEEECISAWKFHIANRRDGYFYKIAKCKRDIYTELSMSNFYPVANMFNDINRLFSMELELDDKSYQTLSIAKASAYMYGAGTSRQRRDVFYALNAFYKTHAPLYNDVFNAIHGFNLARIKRAGVSILTPSLEANHISEAALNAMFEAIAKHRERARDAIRLRAPYINTKDNVAAAKDINALNIYDLTASAPSLDANSKDVPEYIPYNKAIEIIKEALFAVSPKMADYIDLIHKRGCVDAAPSNTKVGGAYCEKFDALKQQRIFSSYMGNYGALITQAHELGHAYHYHLLEGQKSILSDYPMTLAESASAFNEALVRSYLLEKSSDKKTRFELLWQEIEGVATFLLHIPTRFDFEISFLEERSSGLVSVDKTCALMDRAWEHNFGSATQGTDTYLWCSKLHYYKTDQFLYNYPYTVGYIISLALLALKEKEGASFYPSYESFLLDTGSMSVDECVQKHLGYDITKPDFWEAGINKALGYVDAFEREFKL